MALSAKLRAPGWYRAALYDVLGFAFAFGLVVLIRWLMHQHPVIDGRAITIVAMIAVPLAFMIGLGAFDYWFYWAIGRPTPNTVWAHRMHLTPKWFDEIAPAGNLRDYNPGIEIQAMRWKGNGRDAVANSNSGVRKVHAARVWQSHKDPIAAYD